MDSQLTTLRPPLHQTSPTTTQFQQTIKLAQVTVQDGQHKVEAFSSVVDCSFTLWNHLQNPPKVSTIEDRVCTAEVEVTQQKQKPGFFTFRECVVMLAIAAKTKRSL
jgi:hypothetical protein